MNKTRLRNYLIGIASVFVLIAFIDSLGAFDNKSWIEIPHGGHSHYLPKDYKNCDPPLEVTSGTQTRPGVGETVNCQGIIAPEPVM